VNGPVAPPTNPNDEFEALSSGCSRLRGRRDALQDSIKLDRRNLADAEQRSEIGGRVTEALAELSEEVFREEIGLVEKLLTRALQDVLGQPIQLKAEVDWRNNSATVDFQIERAGELEDILRGQGGSVANVLSVGLRIFALQQLGAEHRKVLILDEQDCWLRPDRVPAFVNLLSKAARELDFQMIVISHHDVELFEENADRIIRLVPGADGTISTELVGLPAREEDAE
jgi:ABC-type glutathione transport system ATPase component